jgi:predicted site-specific integrase-resolvase
MPPDDCGEYVTLIDAAHIAGISLATLDRWAREGRIASEVTPKGARLVLKAELIRITVNREGPVPPAP